MGALPIPLGPFRIVETVIVLETGRAARLRASIVEPDSQAGFGLRVASGSVVWWSEPKVTVRERWRQVDTRPGMALHRIRQTLRRP